MTSSRPAGITFTSTLLATALWTTGHVGATAPSGSSEQDVSKGPRIVARFQGELVDLHGGIAYTSFRAGRDGRGVRAYDAHCRGWCSPLWTGPGWLGLQTVARGTAYIGRYRRIDAYATLCSTAGQRCAPDFHIPPVDPAPHGNEYWTRLSLDSPVVTREETYVPVREAAEDSHHGGDGQGRVFAFPRRCEERCVPTWKTPLFDGSLAVQAHGPRVYVTSHESLAVFPKSCESRGRTCRALWRGPLDVDGSNVVLQPILADGLVLVRVVHDSGGGEGQPTGVSIFDARCPDAWCQARRFIPTPVFGSLQEVVKHRFFVVSRSRRYEVVRGFTTRCGISLVACGAVWRGRVHSGDPQGIAVTRSRVYLIGGRGFFSGGGTLRAFPIPCREGLPARYGQDLCRPEWTFRPPGGLRSGPLLGPDGTLLVAGAKTLYAIPHECDVDCSSVWTWSAPSPMRLERVAGNRIFVTFEGRTLELRAPA